MDLYYTSILTGRYDPGKWWGDAYQENSGLEEMYDRINALNPTLVIDAGCGRNRHKPYIQNLIGFDASPFPEADIHCAISEAPFETNSADAVLVLGSVQFISRDYIISNMEKIISWVKFDGLIEMRTLLQNEQARNYIKKYDTRGVKVPWDNELRDYLSQIYNLEYVIEPWIYAATAPLEVIEKKAEIEEQAMAKRELKRECWTWRKKA